MEEMKSPSHKLLKFLILPDYYILFVLVHANICSHSEIWLSNLKFQTLINFTRKPIFNLFVQK